MLMAISKEPHHTSNTRSECEALGAYVDYGLLESLATFFRLVQVDIVECVEADAHHAYDG